MKWDVDLTRNGTFTDHRPFPWHKECASKFRNFFNLDPKGKSFHFMFRNFKDTDQWFQEGRWREMPVYDNPKMAKERDDFKNGIGIIPTGSRDTRHHKLYLRGITKHEICEECGRTLQIPWRAGCSCYLAYRQPIKISCHVQLGRPNII